MITMVLIMSSLGHGNKKQKLSRHQPPQNVRKIIPPVCLTFPAIDTYLIFNNDVKVFPFQNFDCYYFRSIEFSPVDNVM